MTDIKPVGFAAKCQECGAQDNDATETSCVHCGAVLPVSEPDTEQITLDAGDVTVIRLPVELCAECQDEQSTHFVMLELRGNGMTTEIAQGCKECMDEIAERLRASLPQETKRNDRAGC